MILGHQPLSKKLQEKGSRRLTEMLQIELLQTELHVTVRIRTRTKVARLLRCCYGVSSQALPIDASNDEQQLLVVRVEVFFYVPRNGSLLLRWYTGDRLVRPCHT